MNTETFDTTDFYLSAYLLAMGIKLAEHRRQNGYSVFTFLDSSRAQTLMESFFKIKARIEPNTYGRAIRSLKRLMHDGVTSTTTTTGYKTDVTQTEGNYLGA